MSYASKQLYTGDGNTVAFLVSFPFISPSHVNVYVNNVLMLDPLNYSLSGTTVTFSNAPESNDAIWFRRNTSPTTLLVDFHDGSVLGEAELDLQYQHNFYLYQEATDSFNELINNSMLDVATGAGIVETETDAILAAMVNEMLNLEAADTIQQRVTDIDNNAEAIITQGEGLQAQITTISETTGDISARYGVTLSVNGYVTGFLQNNDGNSGNFIILADKFAIVDPSGDAGETEFIPFGVAGGVVSIQNLEVSGSLMVAGSIIGSKLVDGTIGSTQIGADAITTTQLNAEAVTAAKIEANTITGTQLTGTKLSALFADLGQITAGDITLDSDGFIQGGQTAYNTGEGFFLGYDSDEAAYTFSIGNSSAGHYLAWDGTTLIIKGQVYVGNYEASDVTLLTAATERSEESQTWVEKKKFTIDRGGVVRVTVQVKHSGPVPLEITTRAAWRIKVDGVVEATENIIPTTYGSDTNDVTVSTDSVLTIELRGGLDDFFDPFFGYIKDCTINADVVIPADGGSVDTD